MRPLRLTCVAGFAVLLFSVGASTVRADSFVLTGDSAVTGGTVLNLFLSGPNFSLRAAAADAPKFALVLGCGGLSPLCTSGEIFRLDRSVDAGGFTGGSIGVAQVNGTSYGFRIISGTVNWTGTGVVPTLTDPETTFTVPFTLSGNFVAADTTPELTPIFSVIFETSGIANVTLTNFGLQTPAFIPGVVNFNITSGKAQFDSVPEPATLLLLSMGIAGVALRRYRR